MVQFNFSVKKIGVPVTLSYFGRNYVLNEWSNVFINIYPISYKVNMEWD
jgi:hypothetical protein